MISISVIGLSSCTQHFWNYGGVVSEEYSKRFDECFDEVKKHYSLPVHSTERERLELLVLINKCMDKQKNKK
ncbi:hypothetical protein [Bisgaardia hudsonensis]|nr:hypothetical protein [Bisgaardia hudsonensis]